MTIAAVIGVSGGLIRVSRVSRVRFRFSKVLKVRVEG